jgi:uncharacterized membrane protein
MAAAASLSRVGAHRVGGKKVGVSFEDVMQTAGKTVDAAGVVVIVGGLLIATVVALVTLRDAANAGDVYVAYRQNAGRAILLGLEFLVAGDIIRTVAVSPSFRSAGVLAVIVFIRTFLSASLQVELDGRLPWRRSQS